MKKKPLKGIRHLKLFEVTLRHANARQKVSAIQKPCIGLLGSP
jgi:hypothetical protein